MRKNICMYFLIGSMLFLSGCVQNEVNADTGEVDSDTKDLKITVYEEVVEIPGLDQAFEMIFVSDTHLSLCDERDEDLRDYMKSRYDMFRNQQGEGAEMSFNDIVNYVSGEEADLLILGGDITDAATWSNIEYVDELLLRAGCPWVYEMGNHDFNYGAIEYFSEKSYSELLTRFQNISQTKNGYQCIEYEDFIVFAVDDNGNQIASGAVTALEEACKKNKPIILISHVPFEPLEESTLIADTNAVWGPGWNDYSKVLMGEHANIPNETTAKFIELLLAEDSPVKLVLSGHVHFYHKDYLKGDILQIISGPGYEKELIKINLVPEK